MKQPDPDPGFQLCGCHRTGEQIIELHTERSWENWYKQRFQHNRVHCKVPIDPALLPEGKKDADRLEAIKKVWKVVHAFHWEREKGDS